MTFDQLRCFVLMAALTVAGCALSPSPPAPEPSLSPSPRAEAAPEPVPEPPPEPLSEPAASPDSSLWDRLQNANNEVLVVLLRHAIAPGTGDPASFRLGDCSTQRNLSEAGRQQAQAIGQTFRDRNVPVAQVLSSQWCRTLDTAEAMDLGPVEEFPPLNSFFRDRSTATAQTQQVLDYLTAAPIESGVIIMVTHQVNITALSDVFPQSGEAVIVAPRAEDVEVLGTLLGR